MKLKNKINLLLSGIILTSGCGTELAKREINMGGGYPFPTNLVSTPVGAAIVNSQIEYVPDSLNYGVQDIFVRPEQTLEIMAADCGSRALVPAYLLYDDGYKPLILFMANREKRIFHVVYSFKENNEWQIIDGDYIYGIPGTIPELVENMGFNYYRQIYYPLEVLIKGTPEDLYELTPMVLYSINHLSKNEWEEQPDN